MRATLWLTVFAIVNGSLTVHGTPVKKSSMELNPDNADIQYFGSNPDALSTPQPERFYPTGYYHGRQDYRQYGVTRGFYPQRPHTPQPYKRKYTTEGVDYDKRQYGYGFDYDALSTPQPERFYPTGYYHGRQDYRQYGVTRGFYPQRAYTPQPYKRRYTTDGVDYDKR